MLDLDICFTCCLIMADPVPSTFMEVVVTIEQLNGTVLISGAPPSTVLTEVTVDVLNK